MALTRAEVSPHCSRLTPPVISRVLWAKTPPGCKNCNSLPGSWRKPSPDRTSREAQVLNLALLGTHTMTLDKSYLQNERAVKIISN